MKPLYVLLIVFGLTVLGIKIFLQQYDLALSARIAMTAMLLFTAIGHFVFPKGMAMMIPVFIPFKLLVVYITGIFEIVASIGLLVPGYKILTGWLLILFFILILPANISAAVKHIDYQKGTTDGNGLNYLWFRIPLQILFIGWVYVSSIIF